MRKLLLFLCLLIVGITAKAGQVEVSSFSETSGDLDTNISYTTAKGGGTSNPFITSNNELRLYQAPSSSGVGGSITIFAKTGVTINSIIIGSSSATSVDYTIGTSTSHSSKMSIAANKTVEIANINDNKVSIYCKGTSSSARLNINYLKVVYSDGTGGDDTKPAKPTFAYENDTPIIGSEIEVANGTVIKAVSSTLGATTVITSETEGAFEYSNVNNRDEVSIIKSCTLTATSSLNDISSDPATLKVTVKEDTPGPTPSGGDFVLLTDLSQLQDGMEVILGYGSNAVGAQDGSRFARANITVNSDNTIATPISEDVYIFTLVKGTGNNVWYFKNSSDNYLSGANSTSVSYGAQGDNSKVTVSAGTESGTYKLVFNTYTTRALLWRAGSVNQFANYAISNASSSTSGEYHYLKIYYKEAATAKPVFSVVSADANTETDSDGTEWYTDPITVTISSATAGATIHYTIDGGDEQQKPSPCTLSVTKSQKIVAYATSANLEQSKPVEGSYKLRAAKPTLTISPADATFETDSEGVKWYTNPIDVKMASTSANAILACSVDGAPFAEVTGGVHHLTGSAILEVYATAGDMDQSQHVTEKYKLRTAMPVITCDDPTEAQSKTVTISCATNGATIEYSIDGGTTWTDYPADGIVFDESGKTVNIVARAASALGESATAEYHVSIYPALKWQPFELVTDITKLVPGDEVIFVAAPYDYALAPYVSNDRNCKATEITKKINAEEVSTVEISPESQSVGIYTIEKTEDGKFRFKGTFTEGYLAAVAGTENLLHTHKLDDPLLNDPKHAIEATVVIDPRTGKASVTFDGESVTHNLMRFFNGSSKIFACYEDEAGSTYDINIYRRGDAADFAPRPTATPQEGVYDKGELTSVTLQCLDADNNAVTDPSLKIYYTTDGSDPRKGGMLYTGPINVSSSITVRAYATMDGHFDSPALIASYDIFEAGKEYRRVTEAEMRHLKADDDIIILGSPSDEDTVYAMSRVQVGENYDSYREAIPLDYVVKSDGRIVINKKNVQILTLLEGDDYYGGYDWRLYASGSTVGTDNYRDGFLLAEGNYNALRTLRIDTPASDRLPNADVRFRTATNSDYGNEYGGVTVQFGSPDGHELDYPKLMALTRTGADSYRFDVRKEADFEAAATASSGSWYVSIFKVFDPTMLYAPSFTNLDSRVTPETKIEITSPNTENNPETEIWYSMDEGATWTKYTEPFTIPTMGTYNVWARTRNANLTGGDEDGYSDIVKQTYIVTDNEIFELVTDASTLKENDRIVFVNAINFPYCEETETGWYAAAQFNTDLFEPESVEPVDASEAIPSQIIIPSESSIQVFRLEYDTSAKNPDRPWVLFANGHENPVYLRSAAAKKFELASLPETIDDRQYFNVGFDIATSVDFGSYGKTNNNYWTNDNLKTDVEANATVTFNGRNVKNFIRYNPNGNPSRFRAYDNGGKGTPSNTTWPVRVYRATKRVLQPTVTVYDAVEAEGGAYESTIETFGNAVRVAIQHNPKTDEGTNLLYSWSAKKENAPVLSEYLKAVPETAKSITLLVDGNSIQILADGEYVDIDGLANIDGRHILRAVASDGINTSPSLPRAINFKCIKPVLAKGEGSNVDVKRPDVYTHDARLYYAYDDNEVTEDEAFRVNYIEGTTELAPIPFDGHDKVKVVAFKDGYEPSDAAVYTPHTFTPSAKAVQLMELTDEGKAAMAEYCEAGFIDDGKVYVTANQLDGTAYVVKERDGVLKLTAITDFDKASSVLKYLPTKPGDAKVNANWTTDYYVEVVDETAMTEAIGEATITEITVYVNGAKEDQTAQLVSAEVENEMKEFRSLLLKRGGAIGTVMLTSTMKYDVQGEAYIETGAGLITPYIPTVYGGSYTYDYSRNEQDLTGKYAGEFLKFEVESRVKKDASGIDWDKSEVLIPTNKVTPHHLDAVVTFFRPNVNDEILARNDIYYNLRFAGVKNEVKGSGVYVDRAQLNGTGENMPEYYRIVIKDVSPREEEYPMVSVERTEYVETVSDGENFGRFDATNDVPTVEAANIPMASQGTIEKFHLGKLAPGISDATGNTNRSGKYVWMYKGHNVLTSPDEVIHQSGSIAIEPEYYHVEVYTDGFGDYASYEYLIRHEQGHNSSDTPALTYGPGGAFVTDDTADPLLGTYVATGFTAADGVSMAWTPVYVFARAPQANVKSGEVNVASLEKVGELPVSSSVSQSVMAERASKAKVALGDEQTAPDLDEVRPMRYHGHTDMNADNITDLTDAAAPYELYVGNPVARKLSDEEVTGVENVAVDDNGDVEYYNLQGVRVTNPGHGVYIERRGNRATKVIK